MHLISNTILFLANSNVRQANGVLSTIEQTVLSKQLQQVCLELEDKMKYIETVENKNLEWQKSQAKLMYVFYNAC